MKKAAQWLAAAGMLLASGCAFSSSQTHGIKEGMTEAQVVGILGAPAETQNLGRSKTLGWWFPRNPLNRGAALPGQSAFVVYLEDGRVVSCGKEGKSKTQAREQASIS